MKYTVEENNKRLARAKELIDAGESYGSVMRTVDISRATLIKHFGYSKTPAAPQRYDERTRAKVKTMVEMGYSYKRIERLTGVSQSAIYKWHGPSQFVAGQQENRHRTYTDEQYAECVRLRREEGKTNSEIVEITGISRSALHTRMGGTPRRLGGIRPWPEGLHDRARYLRECGYNIREIGEIMNIPRSTVGQWMYRMPCD